MLPGAAAHSKANISGHNSGFFGVLVLPGWQWLHESSRIPISPARCRENEREYIGVKGTSIYTFQDSSQLSLSQQILWILKLKESTQWRDLSKVKCFISGRNRGNLSSAIQLIYIKKRDMPRRMIIKLSLVWTLVITPRIFFRLSHRTLFSIIRLWLFMDLAGHFLLLGGSFFSRGLGPWRNRLLYLDLLEMKLWEHHFPILRLPSSVK